MSDMMYKSENKLPEGGKWDSAEKEEANDANISTFPAR